jgi:hypothetical protein
MADSERICVYWGVVVDGKDVIAEDPSDYSPPDDWMNEGCNRLHCLLCAAMLRHRGYVKATENVTDRVAELYSTEDWLSLPYIEEAASYRLYACRCTVFLAARSYVMYDPKDFDPLTDTTFHWRCAGHPAPSLPLTVDGESVADAADVERLVAKILAGGWTPPGTVSALKDYPTQWLRRLYTRLRGLPEADVVGRSVASKALAKRGKELGVALQFFARFPRAAGIDDIVAFLESDLKAASKSHAVRPRNRRRSFGAPTFLATVGGNAELTLAVRASALLQRVLLEGGKAPNAELLTALAQNDPEWLAQNAIAILGGRHRLVRALIDALAMAGHWDLATVAGLSLVNEGGEMKAAAGRWAKDSAVRDRPAAFAIRVSAGLEG